WTPRRPPAPIANPTHLLLTAAEPHRAEVHVPETIVNCFEADLEPGEQVARIHPAIPPAHAAVPADQAALVVAGIDQRLERRPIGARRGGIAAGRRRVA